MKPIVPDLNSKIIKFYKSNNGRKGTFSIPSPNRRATIYNKPSPTISITPQQSQNPQQLKTLVRNEIRLSFQSPGLQYSQLPGNLKLHFQRPPSPPPQLKAIDYTNQVVPLVPVKPPKRKRGEMAQWVYQQMGWQEDTKFVKKLSNRSTSLSPSKKHQTQGRYKSKQITRTSSQNPHPSIYQLVKRELKQKPYQHYNSLQFFRNVKDGKLQQVELSLKQSPTLAQDFDDQRMTPLHWASKQGYPQIVKLICQKYDVNINSQDNYGRTPIYLACQNRRNDCIYRLFIEGGNLTIAANNRKTPKDVAPDLYIKYSLQKIQEIKRMLEMKKVGEDLFKQKLEEEIRASLDPTSAYF